MKRIAKPNTQIPLNQMPEVDNTPASDISIDRLIDDGLVALNREIKNLLTLSARGKLEAADARDLRDHLKMLFEMRERENNSLRGLTDEQLKEKAKALLTDETE